MLSEELGSSQCMYVVSLSCGHDGGKLLASMYMRGG